MDFSFDETQKDVQTLASSIFERATPERIKQVESTGDHIDRDLWVELAKSDGKVTLEAMTANGDPSVAIWSARRNADLLGDAIDREVEIESHAG